MSEEASAGDGIVLREDQLVLVANADGSFEFFVPSLAADARLSRSAELLAAVAAKISDDAWVEDMIHGVRQRRKY